MPSSKLEAQTTGLLESGAVAPGLVQVQGEPVIKETVPGLLCVPAPKLTVRAWL